MAGAAPAVEIVNRSLQFPEGTIFVGDTLYFVDYAASNVLRLEGNTVRLVWHGEGCGANGLLQVPEGLLVACFDGGVVARISLAGKVLATIRPDDGDGFAATNDFAADAKGGVYITASGALGSDTGKLYYLGSEGPAHEVAHGLDFANGVAVSPDGRLLYVTETGTGHVLAFTIGADGRLRERRVLATLTRERDGRPETTTPDSMRIDRHGNLFIALYNGGGFDVIRPDGSLLAQVDLPGQHHTTLAITPDGKSVIVSAVDDGPRGSYRGRLLRVANPAAE